jgi:asparagine synthase (glutamine-hydrolysing)
MTRFSCVFRPSGAPLGQRILRRYITPSPIAEGHAEPCTLSLDSFAASVDRSGGGPVVALVRRDLYVGVGHARLDNRQELTKSTRDDESRCDLQVAVEYLIRHGAQAISGILGDFAFVVYNGKTHELILARDTFGVRTLHYTECLDLIAVSSSARTLVQAERYDLDFIGEFLINGHGPSDRSIFADIRPLAPAHFATVHSGHVVPRCYWQIDDVAIDGDRKERDAVGKFRELLQSAVRLRVDSTRHTWARLSGGLDSSSIVCAAQDMVSRGIIAGRGIEGTITTVDTLGRGDEREFAQAVLCRYPMPNEIVKDFWLWYDDGAAPPLTDLPTVMYPFFARDRYGAAIVRRHGVAVLLCGLGADHYLTGAPWFITDYVAAGRVIPALKELIRWSAALRTSFWKRARDYAIIPFLPESGRIRWIKKREDLPKWLDATFAAGLGLHDRLRAVRSMRTRPGDRFRDEIHSQMGGLGASLQREISGECLEMRYPFLYRPLVEHSLTLTPSMIMRPHQSKWVLREAMHGIVPDLVRLRTGKGTIGARVRWSFAHEHERVAELIDAPILGDLGCIDVSELARAVSRVQRGKPSRTGGLMALLALETWLRVRSGRWNVRPTANVQAS